MKEHEEQKEEYNGEKDVDEDDDDDYVHEGGSEADPGEGLRGLQPPPPFEDFFCYFA